MRFTVSLGCVEVVINKTTTVHGQPFALDSHFLTSSLLQDRDLIRVPLHFHRRLATLFDDDAEQKAKAISSEANDRLLPDTLLEVQ